MAEYDITSKEPGYAASFEDVGPPYDPRSGPDDRFFRRVVDNLAEFVVAFRHDGTITYVSESVRPLLGYEPDHLLGESALSLIHPDDLAMAADTVYHAARVEGWRPPRPFRLLHADGRATTFEVEGLSLFHVPEVASIVAVCRWAEEAARIDRTIALLVAHAPLGDVLAEVVHAMWRPGWRLEVAIRYDRGDGEVAVADTGLPEPLRPADDDPALPWARAVADGRPVYDVGLSTLPADLRAAAEAVDLHSVWALPIDDGARRPACVVVWNHELVEPEFGQETLLHKLVDLVRFALEGRARAEELERAALTDHLTGLANRRAFERALGALAGADAVAVLFVDLDGFKAINDRWGHAVGDVVLAALGRRLGVVIRPGDLAARVGGDEFAVLCTEVPDEITARRIADRVRATVAEPIPVPGVAQPVAICASVGIALATPGQSADPALLLEVADQRMYAAKAGRRGGT